MYSQIRQHGDRQTTGDWQFEDFCSLGVNIFLKLPIAHALSVTGDTALTDANPACAPLKRNWGLGRAVGGLDKLLGAWISDLGLGLVFWTLDKKSGPWIRNLVLDK